MVRLLFGLAIPVAIVVSCSDSPDIAGTDNFESRMIDPKEQKRSSAVLGIVAGKDNLVSCTAAQRMQRR